MGLSQTLRIEQLDGVDSGCIVVGPPVQSALTGRGPNYLFLVSWSEVTQQSEVTWQSEVT